MVRQTQAGTVVLGAYAARSCPVATQWDVVRPVEPAPAPAFFAALGRAGLDHEATVFDELALRHPTAEVIGTAVDVMGAEARTTEAMSAGVPLVLGARLPVDHEAGRVARPDVLLRVGDQPIEGRWRYRAIDVKHHSAVVAPGKGAPAVVQELAAMASPDADEDTDPDMEHVGRRDRRGYGDLMQLAHYHRALDACGRAPPEAAWAGVLGRDGLVVWYRLDLPLWQHTDTRGSLLGHVTTLAVYDHEFAYRQRIATAATAHVGDPSQPLPLVPVQISECDTCRWRGHCGRLLAEREDVSLLPGINLANWRALRSAGLDTIPALAAADPDATVAGLSGQTVRDGVEHARARVGPEPVYLRRHVSRFELPRADVEVDVDMENVEAGAYLWGALAQDRSGRGLVRDGYRAFVAWDPDAAVAGCDAFAGFWQWLHALRARCAAAGASFAAYCWSASAENRWLKAGGGALGIEEEVEAFIASPQWIDLLATAKRQLVTGYLFGLKEVAPLTGFAWRDDDPGGAQSTLWWQQAVDPDVDPFERERVRQRLLDYNEDDVAATAHIRAWLDAHRDRLCTTPEGASVRPG